MEWDDKTKMVHLGNKNNESKEAMKEYQDFVLQHLDKFDIQAWDMLLNITELIPSEMEKEKDFWNTIYPRLHAIDINDLGFRSAMRHAMLETIIEEWANEI